MTRRVSEKTKLKQHRSEEGENYQSWDKVTEFSGNVGTPDVFTDWKSGRTMNFLSQGEFMTYLILRWQDNVETIYEQYALDLNETLKIANMLGYKHPHNNSTRMTTDLLVVYTNGSRLALSVKGSYDSVFGDKKASHRAIEKQTIEYIYWKQHGVPWKIIFKDRDINVTYAKNIERAVGFYNPMNVKNKTTYFMYLLAHKKIEIDMTKHYNFAAEAKKYISDSQFNDFMKNKTDAQ